MKKVIFLLLAAGLFSCSKKDAQETLPTGTYYIRVAAIETNGSKSYTPTTWVKAGKVAVEFETADVSGIKEYQVEVSADGTHFSTRKTIAADVQNPNKLYSDTLMLK